MLGTNSWALPTCRRPWHARSCGHAPPRAPPAGEQEVEEEENSCIFVTDHQVWLVCEGIDTVYASKLMKDALISKAKDIAQANAWPAT